LATISLLATAGCSRSGGDGQPAAAVNGPNGDKAADAAPAKPTQDPLHPVVVFETSAGSFTVKLDAEKAPLTVSNFLRYVSNKYYDGTIIHQVQKDFPKVVLGGTYTPDLKEKAGVGSYVRNEADKGVKNRRGTIAMARQPDVIDSATSMFFINLADNDVLDYKDRTPEKYGYCVFGEVTDGLNVVDSIGQVAVKDLPQVEHTPVETIAIKSVRRLR
jgi:peptidyl-prolyl cis-trans isomerase B (cyclophilin B)